MTILQNLRNSIKGYFSDIANDPFGLKYEAERKKKLVRTPVLPTFTPSIGATITSDPLGLKEAKRKFILTSPATPPIGNTLYGIPKTAAAPPAPAIPNVQMITGYDQQGNPVQVEKGKYVPGISLTPPILPTVPASHAPTQSEWEQAGNTSVALFSSPAIPAIPEIPAEIDPYGTPEYKTAVSGYESSLKMTPEEEANAKAQADLEASMAIGQANTSNQPIPMDFITGQQAAIEKRGLTLQQPLAARAALLQAKRIAALDASKFKLEQMNKQIEYSKSASTPVSVGAGSSLIDPRTGRVIYKSPTATENKLDTSISEVGGRKLLINNQTGQTIKDLGATGTVTKPEIIKINGIDYQVNADGSLSTPTTPEEAQKITALQKEALSSAQQLMEYVKTNKGTSALGFTGVFGTAKIPGTAAYNLSKQYDNLKSLLSLENIKYLKGQGQVSDAERRLLADASTKLDKGLPFKEFKKTLVDIISVLSKVQDNGNAAEGGFNW